MGKWRPDNWKKIVAENFETYFEEHNWNHTFEAGADAMLEALIIERTKIAARVRDFLMGHYYVKSGDKYRLNHEDLQQLDKLLKGEEPSEVD